MEIFLIVLFFVVGFEPMEILLGFFGSQGKARDGSKGWSLWGRHASKMGARAFSPGQGVSEDIGANLSLCSPRLIHDSF